MAKKKVSKEAQPESVESEMTEDEKVLMKRLVEKTK